MQVPLTLMRSRKIQLRSHKTPQLGSRKLMRRQSLRRVMTVSSRMR